MGGPSLGQMQSQGNFGGGAGRGGGMAGGRGGGGVGPMGRGGRGSNVGGNRGMGMNRGRGGGTYGSGGGGRGGASGPSGPLRGHQSRDRGGFGGGFNRRGGGGSFSNGPHHNQGSSFRDNRLGRSSGGSMHGGHGGRSGRSENYREHNRGSSNAVSTASGGSGKRDENRRTLTDFKIVGLEIQNVEWRWGQIPTKTASEDQKISVKEEIKAEDGEAPMEKLKAEDSEELIVSTETEVKEEKPSSDDAALATEKDSSQSLSNSLSAASPARLRIYFHTPPNADDARPIIHAPSFSDIRKGKRKKLDDDDGDAEEQSRGPRPPPIPSGNESVDGDSKVLPSVTDVDSVTGRGSVAPSVAETASEADWLMAAIAEGEDDGEGEPDGFEPTQIEDGGDELHDHDGERYCTTDSSKRNVDGLQDSLCRWGDVHKTNLSSFIKANLTLMSQWLRLESRTSFSSLKRQIRICMNSNCMALAKLELLIHRRLPISK